MFPGLFFCCFILTVILLVVQEGSKAIQRILAGFWFVCKRLLDHEFLLLVPRPPKGLILSRQIFEHYNRMCH